MGLTKICIENKGESFKFKQDTTGVYDDLCTGGSSSRVGLCAGLSTVWFYQALKEGKPSIMNNNWVDGNGRTDVMTTTNRILSDTQGSTWSKRCQNEMKSKGFTFLRSYQPLQRMQCLLYFTDLRYTNWTNLMIIIYGNGENSHAVAVNKNGEDVKFFDANHGYFHFTTMANFVAWFNKWAEKTEPVMGSWYSLDFYK